MLNINRKGSEVLFDKTASGDVRFMDIAKAFGIIAIVVGHSDSPLKPYVYLYHLALFYFISGYFFRDEYIQAPFTFIKKRMKSLYLPYISYQLPFLLLHNLLLQIGIYSYLYDHSYTLREFFTNAIQIMTFLGSNEQLLQPLWFLFSLFFVALLFLTIRIAGTYLGKREWFTFIAVLFLFSFGIGAWYKSAQVMINIICVAPVIYYAGYFYRRIEQHIPLHWALALAAVTLLIVNAQYGQIELSKNQFGSIAFFLINSFIGIYVNIYLAKRLTRTTWSNSLAYIGNSTIAIMALHLLAFKAIHLVQIYYYSYPLSYLSAFPILDGASGWWIAYSISGILLPLMAKYCFKTSVGYISRIGKTLLTRWGT